MVKEVEGTFQVGDVSLYTKSWLVSPLPPCPTTTTCSAAGPATRKEPR